MYVCVFVPTPQKSSSRLRRKKMLGRRRGGSGPSGGLLLHRAVDSAPVDGVRHEQVRNPVRVQLSRHLPSGRLVLIFLHEDVPFGGRGQVRLVLGELVAWLRAVMHGARPVRFGGTPSVTGSCQAGAPEGGAETLLGPWRSAWAGVSATGRPQ